LNSTNFVLQEDALVPGQVYSFQASFFDKATNILVGSNRIYLLTNSAPTTGAVSVTNISRPSFFDQVELSASGWVDADVPLKYAFSIIQNGREIFLTELQESSFSSVILPISGATTLRVRVFDRQGAMEIRDSPLIVDSISDEESASRRSELVARFRQYAKWGDFRRASQLALALTSSPSNAQNISIPTIEIVDLLSSRLEQNQLAWADSPVLVDLLNVLTNSSTGFSLELSENCTKILETIVASSQSVPSTLSVTTTQLARFTTAGIVSTALQVVTSITKSSSNTPTLLQRLQAVIEALVTLQTRFVVVDELAAQIISQSIRSTSIVVSNASLSQTSGLVVLPGSATVTLSAWNSTEIPIGVISWEDGSFPFLPPTSRSRVIQFLLSGSAEVGSVTASFNSSGQQQATCAIFDEASKMWDSTQCVMETQAGSGEVVCRCTPKQGGNRVTMSLLFTLLDSPSSSMTPAGSVGSPAQDISASSAGAIAGAIVGVIVVLLVVVVLVVAFVPSVRAKVAPFWKKSAPRETLPEMEVEQSSQDGVNKQWTRAQRPRESL
jgi:hypothetical protein